MTSSGSNTWSLPLELNNLESQVAGNIVNGVSSITAGGGISVNASTGAVTVNNTGVISLTPIGGLAISGSTNLSIKNTGVLSATAGSNISITGGTGGTGDITISATPVLTGVTSIIAGSNVTISPSGGTGAVTINATPSSVPSAVIDLAGNPLSYNVTPAQLNNSLFTSSVLYPALHIQTFVLPDYATLSAVYSNTTYLSCKFVNVGKPYAIQFTATGLSTTSYFSSNVSGGAGSSLVVPSPTLTVPFVLAGGFYWTLNTTIDKTAGQVQYYFEYAGQYT